jgi:hypothetical protein
VRLGSPARKTAAGLAASLMALPASPAPAPAAPARPTLETLARQLEGAASRVSPSAQSLTGGPETTQALHMAGLGVVIVLPARALPQQRRQLSLRPRVAERPPAPPAETSASREAQPEPAPPRTLVRAPAPGTVLEQLQRELEQEMAIRAQLLEALERAQQGDDRLLQRALQLQVLAIREQAEAFRIEVERARERAENNLRVQLGTLQRPPSPPPVPAATAAAAAPDTPAAGPAPPPEPPWRAWVGTTQEMAQLNQAMVEQVRDALVSSLEAHGEQLAGMAPEETVTVAVDFVGSPGPMGLRPRVRGTLVLRALVRDVQARQAGKLSSEDFRQRVQARLY